MNNIGGPKSSGRVRGSGVGAAGGSSRPLLSQLPLQLEGEHVTLIPFCRCTGFRMQSCPPRGMISKRRGQKGCKHGITSVGNKSQSCWLVPGGD